MFKQRARGFTLIEIVIVLAIAGLILTVVFLALGGAQASRRDAQRKRDLQRLAAQIETYAGDNGGFYPATLSSAADWGPSGSYTPANFNDPDSGIDYFTVGYLTGSIPGSTPGSLSYQLGGTGCDGVTALTNQEFMVRIRLEQGGGTYCIDTH
jgi:prepilin-type N-terminal cleavage/methylation domain-containing protein